MNYENMPFKILLKELRLKKGVAQKDVAHATGLTPTIVSKYESGKSEPRAETVEKLATYFNVSKEIIFRSLDVPDSNIDFSSAISIPLLSWVDASVSLDLINTSPRESILLDRKLIGQKTQNLSALIALRVTGESMRPIFNSGDYIIVDTSVTKIKDGGFYVLTNSHQEAMLKQCFFMPDNKIQLNSINPQYPVITQVEDDAILVGEVLVKIGIVP